MDKEISIIIEYEKSIDIRFFSEFLFHLKACSSYIENIKYLGFEYRELFKVEKIEDEKPDISDKDLIELPIYQVIGYDLKVRQEEIKDEISRIYRKQIESSERNIMAKQE